MGYGALGAAWGEVQSMCMGTPTSRLKVTAELRVGATAIGSVRLGEVVAGTSVLAHSTEGDFVNIQIPPCELVPADAGESFWIRSDALP